MIKAKDEEHGWNIGLEAVDYVPHDARQRVWGMKKGRLETMVEEGLNPRVVEGMSVLDGVNAARRTLPRVVFHEDRKRVVWGKSVSVLVGLGGPRTITNKQKKT